MKKVLLISAMFVSLFLGGKTLAQTTNTSVPTMMQNTNQQQGVDELCTANGCKVQNNQTSYAGMMNGFYNSSMMNGAGGFWFGYITALLVWAVLVLGIIALVKVIRKK